MDPLNSECQNLVSCVGGPNASVVKIVKKQETPVVLDSGRPLVPSAEFSPFPTDISHLMGDYLPIIERSCVEIAFAGVQPITLCMSQDVGSKLAACWYLGFLPPNRQWGRLDPKIDKRFLINDHKRCLDFLNQKNSKYCRMAIEVLVVNFSNTSSDLPSALKDLRMTIQELEHHMGSVKHVVFSIKEYASCCFTLNNTIGQANEMRQLIDNSKTIFEIIDDLHTCWSDYMTLTVHKLFAFYFKSKVKPASEMYLTKFVIPLNTDLSRKLLDDEGSKMLSPKIMWIHNLKSYDDYIHVDQNTVRLCNAIYMEVPIVREQEQEQIRACMQHALSLEDNPLIERIIICESYTDIALKLPRPRAPLTNASPRSALIQLFLQGHWIILDLTQLNTGYFPHLVHLSILEGKIQGRLDSHHVPCLRTLRIDLEDSEADNYDSVVQPVQELTQAIVNAGRPWQLVVAQAKRGWSLASYDEPLLHPQDGGRENSTPSLPIIRELLLTTTRKRSADEWQLKLNVNISPEAVAVYQNDGLLVWAPECVEKITAFCSKESAAELKFKEEIPERTRILRSLTCENVDVVLDGAALPCLQSLELNSCFVTLSGSFPRLQTLSFIDGILCSPWQISAPMLDSFICSAFKNGNDIHLCPKLLPRLSHLRIKPAGSAPVHCPMIVDDKERLGLSRVKHVVFGQGMLSTPSFDQWQVHRVSHLELELNTTNLPNNWLETEWQCDTLTLIVYQSDPVRMRIRANLDVVQVPPRMPFVKTLTVLSHPSTQVLLDSKFRKLTDLTVTSPEMLGPNLKCRKLKYICFDGKLSDIEKAKCLNPATYVAIRARPRWVYFRESGESNRMSWNIAQSAIDESSDEESMDEID